MNIIFAASLAGLFYLLIGPCSRPSASRLKVYITITTASLPFLLLSPLFRRCLLPRALRLLLPR